jgi:hypothetical protein
MLKFSGHIFPSYFFEILLEAFPIYCNIFVFVVIFIFLLQCLKSFFTTLTLFACFIIFWLQQWTMEMFYFQHFVICYFIFSLLHLTLIVLLFSLTSLLITFLVPCCKGFFGPIVFIFIISLHILFECFIVNWFYFFITLFSSVVSFDLILSLYIYCHLCDLFICFNISWILLSFVMYFCSL